MKTIIMEVTLDAIVKNGILGTDHIAKMVEGYDFKSVNGVKYFVHLEDEGK